MITFLDVDRWREHRRQTGEHLHVIVDGVDVTKRCFRAVMHADHIHGDAFCHKLNDKGMPYYDYEKKGRAEEIITGVMVITPGAHL